mmetsp:Transcript_40962/g.68586  ORF Transcript_40962/g.68586 Transcript_40962/m.68586 type:complete len:284 (-) Transcript_40962:17-868(-)
MISSRSNCCVCTPGSLLRGTAAIMLLCIFQITNGHPLLNEVTRCSREKSRKTRDVLEKFLFPFIEQSKSNMSNACMLHKHKDMYRTQETSKKEIRRHQWKCQECDKTFRSEHFIDDHLTNRHLDTIPQGAEICLADYCDVLHCDHDHPVKSNHETNFKACKPSEMERRRHHCEAIATKCFPTEDGSEVATLHDFFIHQFCDAHTCSAVRNLFPDGMVGGKQILFYTMCTALALCLLVWYTCLYLSHKDTPRGRDLRRARPPPSQGFLGVFMGLFWRPKKKKLY